MGGDENVRISPRRGLLLRLRGERRRLLSRDEAEILARASALLVNFCKFFLINFFIQI